MHPICLYLRQSICVGLPLRFSALTNASRTVSPAFGDGLRRRVGWNAGLELIGRTCSGFRGLRVTKLCFSGDAVFVEDAREALPEEEQEAERAAAHVPVLLKEVVQNFEGRRLLNYVDCNVGAGGHACAALPLLQSDSTVGEFEVSAVAGKEFVGDINGVRTSPTISGKQPMQVQLKVLKGKQHGLHDRLIPRSTWKVLDNLHDAGMPICSLQRIFYRAVASEYQSREMGETVAGGGLRDEQVHLPYITETQTYQDEYKQGHRERSSAFSGRVDHRRQGGRIGEQQERNWKLVARVDNTKWPQHGEGSGIAGFDRRSGRRSAIDSEVTTRIRREKCDGKSPVGRNDEDAAFDKRSRLSRPDGRHYGYLLKKDGPNVGEFSRFDSPSLSRGSAADYKHYERTRPDLRVGESSLSRRDLGASDLAGYSEANFEGRHSSPRSAGFPRRQQGEKKWQYAVRKKQQLAGWNRGKVNKSPQTTTFVDDEDLGNEPWGNEEEWRRKKLEWLCRELPGLKPRGVVTILNEQRGWIRGEDVKYIVEQLLKINQFLRAHRVLKWEMQQPWYEYNFELNTQVANALGENNKLSRTRDLYDLMIQNQEVPELTTYVLLVNCYIREGTNEALQRASYLFNQMSQMGEYEPPASLRLTLFKALAQKNLTFIEQADKVFNGIKAAGLVASEDMYNQLAVLHGTSGNKNRVDSLMKEMQELGLKVGDEVYCAVIKACIIDGDVAKAEKAFSDLKKVWERPIPSIYAALIKLYGKAGVPEIAVQVFEELKQSGISININVYEPIIEVTAAAGNREWVEKLVEEAQRRGLPSMQGCYNALMRMYSEIGELELLERVFKEMPVKGHHPSIASYNVVLEAYVRHSLLEKAQALYDGLKKEERIVPNINTYGLLIKAYGGMGDSSKLIAVFKDLAEKKMDVPKGQAAEILKEAVGSKQIQALKNSNLKLDKDQREVLAGVLLGGANIQSHDRNRTYEVHFELDVDDQVRSVLLQHLYSKFADWSVERPKERVVHDPKHPSQTKKVLAFQTVSHGSFRFFAHQYRPDGKPKIPRLIHRWLSPQTLAYWYMYAGRICFQTGGILLNASPYTSKELTLVVDALKAKTIECEKRQTKDELILLVTGKSASWLWKLMQPHIVPAAETLLNPEDRKGYENVKVES